MLLGKQIIRKNALNKRHRDPHLFLLGSVSTQHDIYIVTSKLPTNKQVLLTFIAIKEEFDQTKNKKPFHHNYLHLLVQMIMMKDDCQKFRTIGKHCNCCLAVWHGSVESVTLLAVFFI